MMSDSINLDSMVVVASDQVSTVLQEGDTAILNLKDGIYYGLNSVGSRIWNLIQSPKSVLELRDTLVAEYDVDVEVCTRELIDLLDELSGKRLIEVNAAGE
jgi:Coenzyme PQQ synthesis protein D (PqqD)